jgi:molecular chaperone GrpE
LSEEEKTEKEKQEENSQEKKLEPVAEALAEVKEEAQIEILKERLAQTEEQNKNLEDRLLRLAAEFDNYKKRTAKEFAQLIKNANEGLISELVLVLDNFRRAFETSQNSKDPESFKKGIEIIYNQLKQTLEKEGLKEIIAKGEKFDPNFHEAVSQMESEEEEGIILEEISRGYILNGKVIKHSQVVVAKRKQSEEKKE